MVVEKSPKTSSAPTFSIDFPSNYSLFGKLAPNYSLTITSETGNFTWYEFLGVTANSTPIELEGIPSEYFEAPFNQTLWNSLDNGTSTVRFYVNNSLGEIGYVDAIIRIDTDDPIINIISPTGGFFNSTPPDYTIEISDPNLNVTWYTLNTNQTKHYFTSNGTIDGWSYLNDGLVNITFFANDSVSNEYSDSVQVTKDVINPIINIISPTGGYFNSTPPDYTIEISDTNMNKSWYILNANQTKHFFTSNGTIEGWSFLNDGLVNITFYVNDSVGNENSDSVQVTKDVVDPGAPSLLTSNPLSWTNVDLFNLSWSNPADTSGISGAYYKLNIAPTTDTDGTYIAGANIESITGISVISDNIHTVYVWLNDTVGNVNHTHYATTQLYLDTTDPSSPSGLVANPISWTNIDSFNLSWSNPSDLSGISGAFYKFDDEPTSNEDGDYVAGADLESLIDISIGSDDNHTIYVWLNDTAGNINYNNSATIQLYLDTTNPSSPTSLTAIPNSWTNVDKFNLSWSNPSDLSGISGVFYTFDVAPISNNDGVYVAGADLESLLNIVIGSDGNHTIYLWLNDTAGNINHTHYATTQLYLDTTDPSSPGGLVANPISWTYIDSFNLSWSNPGDTSGIIGAYYSLDSIPTTDTDGVYVPGADIELITGISVTSDGVHTVYVWLNDTAGNIDYTNFAVIQLYLDTIDPSPPSSLFATPISWTNVDSFNLSWSNPGDTSGISGAFYKFDVAPTSNDNGIYMAGADLESLIDISIGSDGNHTIYVWLNDTAGNINYNNYATIQLYLDTASPSSPTGLVADPVSWTNVDSFNLSWTNPLDDSGIAGVYYKFDSAPTSNNDGVYVAGTDLESLINISIGSDGIHTIYLWLNDSAGNINYNNYNTTQLYLDTSNPVIIDSQVGDDEWKNTAGTTYDVDFSDPLPSSNLDYAQYKITSETGQGGIILKDWTDIFINLGTTSYTTDWSVDFTACKEGINYISVRVYDEVGNFLIVNDTFYIKKDTTDPILVINAPANNTSWDTRPPINVTYYEPNFASLTYTVIGYFPINNWLDNNTEVDLDSGIWGNLDEGAFQIVFTCFDSLGQSTLLSLTLYKDTIGPVFNSIIPSNFTCHTSAPNITISYLDPNLDKIYYKIGASTIFILNDIEQPFDSSIWDGLSDEPFTIEFYANDTFGRNSNPVNLTLIKDTILPLITVNSPANSTYYSDPPLMNIIMSDLNPDTIWYTAMGTKVILSGVEDFSLSLWNILDQGEFQVNIFANDSAGNINNSIIFTLYKDTVAPLITVNLPLNNTYWRTEPIINIEVFDPNLDIFRYSVPNYTVFPVNGTDSPMPFSVWDSLGEGPFILEIYATDIFGHINDSIKITLYKDLTPPNIDIISPQPYDLFGEDFPPVDLNVTDTNLEDVWYQLSNGTVVTNYYPWTGSIDQVVWDSQRTKYF